MVDCRRCSEPITFVTHSIPQGAIVAWSGAVVDIPDGFALCDGTQGTPNLRTKFVIGAGDSFALDAVGGATHHAHDFTGPGHIHAIDSGTGIGPGSVYNDFTASTPITGTTDGVNGQPPFYALAYIMER